MWEKLQSNIFKGVQILISLLMTLTGIAVPTKLACGPASLLFMAFNFVGAIFILFVGLGFSKLIGQMKEENAKFQKNNEELQSNLNILKEHNEEIRKNLKTQKEANEKLLIIQKQSQDLVMSLMKTGDDFKNFSQILETASEKNLQLTDKLNLLINGLTINKFKEIDKNGDGFIDLEELRAFKN